MSQSRAQKNGGGSQVQQGVVKLSNLAIKGREFELEGEVYETKTPISFSLSDIARLDKQNREVNEFVSRMGDVQGSSATEEELEKFDKLLNDIVVEVSNVPMEVVTRKEVFWWQKLLVIGMFQSTTGMDFLSRQLPKLGLPELAATEVEKVLKSRTMTTPTSQTP